MPANWFWQPDREYVNTVNTVNLRSINGIRMSVGFMVLGGLAFCWTTYAAFPWHMEPCLAMPCLEPLGRTRAAEFARGIYDSMGLFLAALLGIAVGAYGVKRATDTDHVERKEAAKAKGKAIGEAEAKATKEHVAPTVTKMKATGADTVEISTAPSGGEPTPEPEPEEHEWAEGDDTKAGTL